MKKRIIVLLLAIFSINAFSQSNIDLKTLILQPKDIALKKLYAWGIKAEPSAENPDYFYAFGTGFQMEMVKGKVNTIWIYFSNGTIKHYSYQVDQYIEPRVSIKKLIEVYGTPGETGNGYSSSEEFTGGWVKWKTDKYQLHCELVDGTVTMVTLMEPNWYPGKE